MNFKIVKRKELTGLITRQDFTKFLFAVTDNGEDVFCSLTIPGIVDPSYWSGYIVERNGLFSYRFIGNNNSYDAKVFI